MVSEDEGRIAVEWARAAIGRHLSGGARSDPAEPFSGHPVPPPVFGERRGVFVTLHRYPQGTLRGCVGFPLPHLPLAEGIPRAAVAAAVEDHRFAPVSLDELDRIQVEVSVLTTPRPVVAEPREEMPSAVVVGRDGLLADGWGSSGLLLPQVAVELGWDSRTFLDETCIKAGLPPDAWLDPAVKIRAFEAEIFRETTPGGPVVRAPTEVPARSGGKAGRRK
ncbi:MAG: TIGR00296 family protein [Thermoplasmata archaeon]|nr:TIGR00296 family protein [Thermoplasmata archaeon]